MTVRSFAAESWISRNVCRSAVRDPKPARLQASDSREFVRRCRVQVHVREDLGRIPIVSGLGHGKADSNLDI